MIDQEPRQLIDGPTLGDRGQVDLQPGDVFAKRRRRPSGLQVLVTGLLQQRGDLLLGRCRGTCAGVAKAPEIDQWSDGDVVHAVGLCADAIGLFHQFDQFGRHRQPLGGRAPVEAHQVGVRQVGGHLRVDVVQALLDLTLQGILQRRVRGGRQLDAVTGTHRPTCQFDGFDGLCATAHQQQGQCQHAERHGCGRPPVK